MSSKVSEKVRRFKRKSNLDQELDQPKTKTVDEQLALLEKILNVSPVPDSKNNTSGEPSHQNSLPAKRKAMDPPASRSKTKTVDEQLEVLDQIFNAPFGKKKLTKDSETSPAFHGVVNKEEDSFPDRTVLWRGRQVPITKEEQVFIVQDEATKAFLCFMGRCHGTDIYPDCDRVMEHISVTHSKAGSKDGLRFQLWRYKAENHLVCGDCNLRFNDEEKLASHFCDTDVLQNANLAGRSVGSGERPKEYYVCSICGLRSTTKCGKLNHERTHVQRREPIVDRLVCKECGFRADTESQLWIHESVHPKSSFVGGLSMNCVCPHCGFRTRTRVGLHQHVTKRHRDVNGTLSKRDSLGGLPIKRETNAGVSTTSERPWKVQRLDEEDVSGSAEAVKVEDDVTVKMESATTTTVKVEEMVEAENETDSVVNGAPPPPKIRKMEIFQDEDSRLHCLKCGMMSMDTETMAQHVCHQRTHPECDRCGKLFFSDASLEKHACRSASSGGGAPTRETTTKPSRGGGVEKRTNVSTKLRATKTVSKPEPDCKPIASGYACEKCDEIFASKIMLVMHEAERHRS